MGNSKEESGSEEGVGGKNEVLFEGDEIIFILSYLSNGPLRFLFTFFFLEISVYF